MDSEDVRAIDLAAVLAGASVLALGQGDLEAAQAYVNRAVEIDAELQPHARHSATLLYLRGSLAHRAGDWNTALDLLRSGIDLAGRTTDGAHVAALCLQQLAEVSLGRGDMPGARDWAARALELSSSLGFPHGRGLALLTMGTLSHQLGDLTAAQGYLEASASVGRDFGHGAVWVIYALLNEAHVAVDRGDFAGARSMLRESLGRWHELGSATTLSRVLGACAHLAAAEGRSVQAMRLVGAAEQLRISARRPVSAIERELQERWLAPARAVIGESASESAYRDGLGLSENLRAFALRDLDAPAAVNLPELHARASR
jgi:tetratricopeptide (TPR) repeat protein